MKTAVIRDKQALTYLKWSHIRSSSGTAGTFLKSESSLSGRRVYYKLSNFDMERGVIGHECANEIIVDRLLTLLEVEHIPYQLIHAAIEVDGREYETWLCASEDFKKRGESKIALDDYFRMNAEPGESHYDFCIRNGWGEYIDTMLAVDYLILNRDRHGANIEVLRNARAKTLRIAPLFDHGLSLLFSCSSDQAAADFDVMADLPCQNFIGSRSCKENLKLIRDKSGIFQGKLKESDHGYLLEDLDEVLSETLRNQIWNMIWRRYQAYENL